MRAFELWGYPDSSLNLVVVSDTPIGKREKSFPCAVHQLQAVVDGNPLTLERDGARLLVSRSEDRVLSEFSERGDRWRQCIDVETLQEVLDRIRYRHLTSMM